MEKTCISSLLRQNAKCGAGAPLSATPEKKPCILWKKSPMFYQKSPYIFSQDTCQNKSRHTNKCVTRMIICMCHTYDYMHVSHIWRCHTYERVTRMNVSRRTFLSPNTLEQVNESYHTYDWETPHLWRSHVAHFHKKLSNKQMSHVTHMNESCHTYEWVMSHIWMSHVTHMNESCHTYEWVMSHI